MRFNIFYGNLDFIRMAVINNLGGHAGFGDTSSMGSAGRWPVLFRLAAWKLRDGRYSYMEKRSAPRKGAEFFHNTYSQDQVEPRKPDDILGVYVVPLPD